MQLSNAIPEGNHAVTGRLDDELTLGFVLDPPFPAIDRLHHRKQVHARRELRLHERLAEGLGIRVGRQASSG